MNGIIKMNSDAVMWNGAKDTVFGNDEKGKSLLNFANSNFGLGADTDPIEQKKEAAKKQAMKIIGDAFDGEDKMDKGIEKERDRFKELTEQRGELLKQLKAFEVSESEVGENEDETNPKEEISRLLNDVEAEMKGIDMALRSTKIERLKHDNMRDAYDEADIALDAAREDIVGTLTSEAITHMDDELKEKKEEAKEAEEEKKELNGTTNDIESAQEQVDKMLNRLGLIADDIKGAAVDEQV